MATINLNTRYAFPSAIGHGRNTTGGRDQTLFFVTNISNSGAGSFRQALSDAASSGGGIIIFRTGGTITLTSSLSVAGSNITIAGETAPGGGICIYGGETNFMGQNIIVRHIRFRGGDPIAGQNRDSVRIQSQSNNGMWSGFIFSNCSVSWASDENFSIETGTSGNVSVTNVTVQDSIISEGFDSRSIILWGKNITNVSFIRNYIANTQQRNIRSSTDTDRWEQINNFIFNYGLGINPTADNWVDAIGNVFEDGPSTQIANTIHWETCSSGNCPPTGKTSFADSKLYVHDNIFNGGSPTISSNIVPYITETPNLPSGFGAMPSSDVKDWVLNKSGARALMSDGRDSLDAHVIQDGVNGNTGSWVANESQTTGLPTLASGTPYTDSNNDGISDSWASTHGISSASQVKPTYTINGHTINNTAGYTALEIFLADMAGDFDLLAGEPGVNIPVITLTGASTINLNVGDAYTELGATATDTEDGNLTGSIVVTGTVNTAVAGTYYKYYNVTDSNSNAAVQVVRTIIVSEPGSVSNKTGVHKNLFWSI